LIVPRLLSKYRMPSGMTEPSEGLLPLQHPLLTLPHLSTFGGFTNIGNLGAFHTTRFAIATLD
jgi:hypothetical protein